MAHSHSEWVMFALSSLRMKQIEGGAKSILVHKSSWKSSDYLAVFILRKRAESLSANIPLRTNRKQELGPCFIIRSFSNSDRIIFTQGQVPLFQFSTHGVEKFFSVIESCRAVFNILYTFLRKAQEADIGRYFYSFLSYQLRLSQCVDA